MNRAIFIDLDGTLIKTKSGRVFQKDKDDWVFNMEMVRVLKDGLKHGFTHIIIVTNQGGIEKGYVQETDFLEKITAICHGLEKHLENKVKLGDTLDFYYATSLDKNNFDRKPNPGMAYKAALDHDLILKYSVMIGDASGREGDFSASDYNFRVLAGMAKYFDVRQIPHIQYPWDIVIKRLKGTYEEEKDRKHLFDSTINPKYDQSR